MFQKMARLISALADGPLYLLSSIAILWLEPEFGRQFFVTGLIAFGLEVPLYICLKRAFKRARPFNQLDCWHGLSPADEFSFPSGHTAAAAVFAGLLGCFYLEINTLLVTYVVLVGASRVALGVHFLGDILAGALLGLACVALAVQSVSMMSFWG
ncbi:phosphatase PAP2 family protein [Simiduia litorea]